MLLIHKSFFKKIVFKYKARYLTQIVLMLMLCTLYTAGFSQEKEEAKKTLNLSGKTYLTNNGISLIPTFSIDKPAAMLLYSIGGERFSFEPDIRFSLEGQPWNMLFWFRYKLIQGEKFKLRVGAHPSLNFRTIDAVSNGNSKKVIETRRFTGGEIVPTYAITKGFQIGMYVMYGRGYDDSQRNTNFIVFNTMFPDIGIGKNLSLGIFPNVYYLKLDEPEGFYFSSTVRLYKKGFPWAIEGVVNQIIDSEILPDRKFVWNISLVHSFNKKYTEAKFLY